MANKRKRSHAKDADRIAQRARTKRNKEAKYTKLIAENPKSPHIENWSKKIQC